MVDRLRWDSSSCCFCFRLLFLEVIHRDTTAMMRILRGKLHQSQKIRSRAVRTRSTDNPVTLSPIAKGRCCSRPVVSSVISSPCSRRAREGVDQRRRFKCMVSCGNRDAATVKSQLSRKKRTVQPPVETEYGQANKSTSWNQPAPPRNDGRLRSKSRTS